VDQKRILLAGRGSGFRGILKETIQEHPDMELMFCDAALGSENPHTENEIKAAVRVNRADVVILDLGAYVVDNEGRDSENTAVKNELVRSILDQFPSLLVIVLSALGQKVVVHSALHLNNPGVNQFLNAIRMCSVRNEETMQA
jgi:hypothetical protein